MPRFVLPRSLRTPIGISALVLLVLLAILAVFAPLIWGDAAEVRDSGNINRAPSAGHLLGTDALGRDIFVRVVVATRLSLVLALVTALIGAFIGILLGAAAVVAPRRIGRILTSVINVAVAFPGLLLALAFAVIFGVGTTGAMLALGIAFAPEFARLTHTLAAGLAGRDFVAAAHVVGVSRTRILVRHILPNIGEPLVVNTTIAAGSALLAFAGLSFLGIGVQAPDFDWGRLLQDGVRSIYVNPAAALGPGAAVVVAGLAFNLFGEAAAAALGQRSRRQSHSTDIRRAPAVVDGHPPTTLLRVENLRVTFPADGGDRHPVRGVTFGLNEGDTVGIIGESGSGKSLTALAIAQLIEAPGRIDVDVLEFDGSSLMRGTEAQLRTKLGTSMALIFQDPMTSFNPTMRIGRQLAEVVEVHEDSGRVEAMERAISRLEAAHVPEARKRAHQYPHEYSGGMRQRAMIGMALMSQPKLIIADEPTTALDVTVQREILRTLEEVRQRTNAAVLMISHDLAVVSQVCDRMLVMYAGRIVEDLPTASMHERAQHPYSRALLAVSPDLTTDRTVPLATIEGRPPEPGDIVSGCAFAPRCAFATEKCLTEDPQLLTVSSDQRLACWNPIVEQREEASS